MHEQVDKSGKVNPSGHSKQVLRKQDPEPFVGTQRHGQRLADSDDQNVDIICAPYTYRA